MNEELQGWDVVDYLDSPMAIREYIIASFEDIGCFFEEDIGDVLKYVTAVADSVKCAVDKLIEARIN